MTTTSTYSGINEETKTSSRVLKPPGGGSSNIFGAADSASAQKPRTSAPSRPSDAGIFNKSKDSAAGGAAAQRTARDGDDSFDHLFGVVASSATPSPKGTSAGSQRVNTHANIFGDSASPPTAGTPSKTHDNIFGDQETASPVGRTSGRYSGRGRGSYNPITGADYKDLAPNHHALHVKELPKPQKEQPPLPCSDGEFQAKEGKMQAVQTSTRITNPPGGKTHKLW